MTAAKGSVQAGAAMTNKYRLRVDGLPPILCTRIGEVSEELVTTDMADRTRQTTGSVQASTSEFDHYVHHALERSALLSWWRQCKAGTPGHKRNAVLEHLGANETVVATTLWEGVFLTGSSSPELAAGEDGSAVVNTYTVSIDNVEAL